MKIGKIISAVLLTTFLLVSLVACSAGDKPSSASTQNAESGIPVDPEHFPDGNFREYIYMEIDQDGILSEEEINSVTFIDVTDRGISSLIGIEYFTELEELHCSNNKLTELDVSKNSRLTFLSCVNNQLTILDMSGNRELTQLWCNGNYLTELNLLENRKLTHLNCAANKLTELDLSNNTELIELYYSPNPLNNLDLSNNTRLITVG